MKRTLWLASERGHDRRMRQHKGEVARAYWRELIEARTGLGFGRPFAPGPMRKSKQS